MRWLALLAMAVLSTSPLQAQTGIEPGDIRLELALEPRTQAPHPGEMILLAIHGTYKIPVVREVLRQPTLDGLDWMQLGEDRWYKAREDGFEVLKMERRMAVFPQHAGQITIAAFTHVLEMLGRNGQTVPIEVTSDELRLAVAPLPKIDGWWFPVRNFEVADRWSNQPQALDPGAAALRVVTLTIEGAAPQRIPPMPELTGAGVHIFPHPEQKIVSLGPDGPLTRVFWRWTVRPIEGIAGYLNPVTVQYFDAEKREHREIRLSAQRVAYAGVPAESSVEAGATAANAVATAQGGVSRAQWSWPAIPVTAVFLLGLLAGLSSFMWSWRTTRIRLPEWLRPDPNQRALKRAAAAGESKKSWRHARALVQKRETPPPEYHQLSAMVFGPEPQPEPDLPALAQAILTATRRRRSIVRHAGQSAPGKGRMR